MEMNEEKIKEVKEVLAEITAEFTNQNVIKDNKIPFQFEDKIYRVRMPNTVEESNAHEAKDNLRLTLYQTKGQLREKVLKRILKENQEIDVDAIEKEKELIQNQMQEKYLELAVLHDTKRDINEIDRIKKDILTLKHQHIEKAMQVIDLMSPSIESKIERCYMTYIASYCTEVLEMQGETEVWHRVWNTMEDYNKSESKLSTIAMAYMTHLLINTKV